MSAKAKYIGIGAGVAVAAIIAVVVMGGMISSGSAAKNSSASSFIPQEHRQNIVNGIIGVKARSYQSYPIFAPSGATNAHVTGKFVASGGSGNDVKVAILNEQEFTNWKNGHQASAYYSTGEKTTDTINTSIPSGTQIYLIYDNTYSLISDKQVNTTVDLVYTN